MNAARVVLFTVLGWIALAALLPASARGDARSGETLRVLYLRAEEHYRRGDFAAALDGYQRAHQLTGLPGFLFNIAQSLRRMGRCGDALIQYRQFVRELPDAANRDAVNELIRRCEARLRRDRTRGPAPPQESLAPLAPRPARSIVMGTSATTDPRGAGGRAALLWTGAGITGALLVSGTVTGVLALRASDEFRRPGIAPDRMAAIKEQGQALRTASTVSFAVAGSVAVGTALVYWLYRPRAPPRIAISLLPGGASVAVSQRF